MRRTHRDLLEDGDDDRSDSGGAAAERDQEGLDGLSGLINAGHRVLRPGGRLMVLEFSQLPNPAMQKAYDLYSFNVIPRMGQAIAGDRDSYQYLVESIRNFPDQETFLSMVRTAGFGQAKYRNLSMGIAALHSGWKL